MVNLDNLCTAFSLSAVFAQWKTFASVSLLPRLQMFLPIAKLFTFTKRRSAVLGLKIHSNSNRHLWTSRRNSHVLQKIGFKEVDGNVRFQINSIDIYEVALM